MIGATNRQRWIVCCAISILLHVGILTFSAVLLIKAARFQVKAGKTSTEMDLIIESVPIPAIPPPTPASPRPSPPFPEEQPTPAPQWIKPAVPPLLKPIFAPTAPLVVPTMPQPPKPPTKPNAAVTDETSSASRGAVSAQPDELQNEPPVYPEESRAAREQGVVILRVEVTAAGEPARVNILKSSGYFRLDQAARQAVQHWKFHPAMMGGTPTSSEADVPVHFKLE